MNTFEYSITPTIFALLGNPDYFTLENTSHGNIRVHKDDVKTLTDLLNKLIQERNQLQEELDNTIEMLNKEVNSSEKAFEGLLNENRQLKQIIRLNTLMEFKND